MNGTTSILGGCKAVIQAPGNYVKLMSLTSIWNHQKRLMAARNLPKSQILTNIKYLLRERSKGSYRIY